MTGEIVKGQAVLLPSPLGLSLAGADFSRGLKLVNTSPVKAISDRYSMAVGKRSAIVYRANEQVYSLVNAGRRPAPAYPAAAWPTPPARR